MDDRFDTWSQRLRASDRDACTELFDAMHTPLLRYATRLTHDEIADVMDIAPRTVTNHVTKALQTLRDRLADHRPPAD